MNQDQVHNLMVELSHLRDSNRDEFEAWYEQANLLDVHDYTFSGWLIERKLIGQSND